MSEWKYYLGKCDYNGSGRRNCKAYITWELDGDRFSMQAEVWNPRETDIYCGGQCVDKVAKMFPNNAKARRMVEVWKRWHLNDMKAGKPVQMAEVERRRLAAEEHARQDPDNKKHFYDAAMKEANWHSLCGMFGHNTYFDWECAILKEASLYEVDGYKFGSAWLKEELSAEVVAEIESWSAPVQRETDHSGPYAAKPTCPTQPAALNA